MKFLAALLSLVAGTSATMHQLTDIKADSKMGQALLSQARLVKEEENQIDITWAKDYSLKFQGCHSVAQWNADVDDKNDVRIETKRLIRFRLCPTSSCSASDAGGCKSGYGDYIIDMNTYLQAYYDASTAVNEYKCAEIAANCDCSNAENADYCAYDCYVAKNMADICADRNPYEEEGGNNEKFKLEEYVACGRWENKRRQLNDNNNKFYIGPYCAEQGGAIFLGLFTDDSCTTFADEYGGTETYLATTGVALPYSAQSIVGMECISCTEPTEYNVDGDDAADEDVVSENCEKVYSIAGKCESDLAAVSSSPNNNGCSYIEGIKIVRKNGTVESKSSAASKTASVFIGLFVVAFVLLAAYVYYLRTKLDRASINLSE